MTRKCKVLVRRKHNCAITNTDGRELSGDALAALQAFYSERDAREKQFQELKAQAEDEEGERKLLSMDAFTENWQDSQFWVRRCSYLS